MNENKQDRLSVYELSYLIASSIPEEKVGDEYAKLNKIIADSGAVTISEEQPKLEDLAYTIKKKTVAGSYDKFDKAYFGWVKFEVNPSKIDSIKKSAESIDSFVRVLVITTVKENTYLGKRSSSTNELEGEIVEKPAEVQEIETPASPEEIDKSIDAMVKEA
jgi:ribosomal protein S6